MRATATYLLLTSVVLAQVPRVGDKAPLPEVDQLWNATFNHFEDTYSKVVVYVWFLPENQGRSFVQKLNRLHDRFHRQGLVVAAVTHRPEDQIAAWVTRLRPRFTVAWEPSNLSMGTFQFMQWPSSVIASSRGIVLWKGGGDGVPEGKIKSALKTAVVHGPDAPLRLILDLPAGLASAQTALERGKLDKALKLLDKPGVANADAARAAADRLTSLLQSKLARAQKAEKAGDLHLAYQVFSRLQEHAPKTRWGDAAKQALARYKVDSRIKKEIDGGGILTKAQDAIDRRDWKAAKKLLQKLVTYRYKGTNVREKAEALLRTLK